MLRGGEEHLAGTVVLLRVGSGEEQKRGSGMREGYTRNLTVAAALQWGVEDSGDLSVWISVEAQATLGRMHAEMHELS